mmetsp:Transcript_26122/g.66490  ORF Transcript_26122/g.66490 Transcript_26122/m.66490 type:complete len:322 (+) Transcript_26122:142-1107(+)
MTEEKPPRLLIFISTAYKYKDRRDSIRKSWFQYKTDPASSISPVLRDSVELTFVASQGNGELQEEAAAQGDITLVDAPEGYEHLWRKALVFLGGVTARGGGSAPDYVMHCDDDSFVRLDLLLPLVASWPRARFYWGYVWDGTGARSTAPIRNPANKSHMPEAQYPLDFYPPFASGCGFVLSRDLVAALVARPLPDYRLLDPPFGIHLCGGPGWCVLPGGPVVPVHEERVRPYRLLPTFRPDTLVQHYLRPEEMRPFYAQALEAAAAGGPRQGAGDGMNSTCSSVPGGAASTSQPGGSGSEGGRDAAAQLYDTLVGMGLLRR